MGISNKSAKGLSKELRGLVCLNRTGLEELHSTLSLTHLLLQMRADEESTGQDSSCFLSH